MVIYSHSRLSAFEECKLKFKYRYIDKIIPEIEKSIESYLGDMVHKTLEWLYTKVKENKNKIPTMDEVIIYYANIWERNYVSEIPIVKKEFTARDYFNKGVKFLINYYVKHKPFDDNTIAVEKRIILSLDGSGEYKIQGFIDRLSYNLKKGEYEIHDYKTSNNLPHPQKIEEDRQLALYSIAIKELYGEDKKISLIWHYLAHDQRIYSRRTNEQLNKLKKETIELIKKIESTTEFHPNKTNLCNWCEYKQICPAWGGKPGEKQKKLYNFQSLKKDMENFDEVQEIKELKEEERKLDIW